MKQPEGETRKRRLLHTVLFVLWDWIRPWLWFFGGIFLVLGYFVGWISICSRLGINDIPSQTVFVVAPFGLVAFLLWRLKKN